MLVERLSKYPFNFEALYQELQDSCTLNLGASSIVLFEVVELYYFVDAFHVALKESFKGEAFVSLISLPYLFTSIVLCFILLCFACVVFFFVPQLCHQLASVIEVLVDQFAEQ